MDKAQISTFIEYMFGWRSLGVDANGDEISVPYSPELRAFMVAFLGEDTPTNGDFIMSQIRPDFLKQRHALGLFLVNMGRSIEPGIQIGQWPGESKKETK